MPMPIRGLTREPEFALGKVLSIKLICSIFMSCYIQKVIVQDYYLENIVLLKLKILIRHYNKN